MKMAAPKQRHPLDTGSGTCSEEERRMCSDGSKEGSSSGSGRESDSPSPTDQPSIDGSLKGLGDTSAMKLEDQPGPSGLCGPPEVSWDSSQDGPSTLASGSGSNRGMGTFSSAEQDRSEAPSPSCESSLGDSRSPDIHWRGDISSPEEHNGDNIHTRMFYPAFAGKSFSEDYHSPAYSYPNLTHNYDSCVSDMSESSPDSSANCSTTSPKDESNGSGMNGHSSSGMNSDQEKISQATFDKVLIDANQRRQIRNKVRVSGMDSGSDSSSGNMCMDMTEVVGTSASNMKLDSNTSDSSGIGGANYMSSAQCNHFALPRADRMPCGVTNSSTGVSTMYNSQGNKISDESKQDSMSSCNSSNRKRHIPWSIARYYYQTKRPTPAVETQSQSIIEDGGSSDFSSVLNKRALPADRKRKRFHRTFTALRQCGLLDLTMQTASLMEQNSKLQKQLSDLHRQAHLMYHTVSHFSKIQPNAFVTPEALRVIEGLKEMVDKNPVGDIDASVFESTSKNSMAIDSGAFSLSNLPASFSDNSAGSGISTMNNPDTSRSQMQTEFSARPKNNSDSAFQSTELSFTATSSSSEKSGQ